MLCPAGNLSVANCQLSGGGELIQPTAVGSPLIVVKVITLRLPAVALPIGVPPPNDA